MLKSASQNFHSLISPITSEKKSNPPNSQGKNIWIALIQRQFRSEKKLFSQIY